MSAAAIAVRPACVSYSGPSWTASSGSGERSSTPGGLQSVTPTRACSGRLSTSSGRTSPAATAGGLLELGAGAPDGTGLPGSGARGDVAEAIGRRLHAAGVAPVRLLRGAITLDELRVGL